MKRAFILLLVLLICGLTACGPAPHTITTVDPGSVSRLVLTRMEDGEQMELTKGADSSDLQTCLQLLQETAVSYRGDCPDTSEHCYRLCLYLGAVQESEIFLHRDGNLCRTGKLRVPEEEGVTAALLEFCSELLDRAPGEVVVEEGRWEPVTEPVETSVPMPVPSAARWHSSRELEATADGWRYIQGEVEINGVRYTVAAREKIGQTTEILYGFAVRNAREYTLSYVMDLYDASGGTMLGFELLGPEPSAPAEGEEPQQQERIPCYYDTDAERFQLGAPPEPQLAE